MAAISQTTCSNAFCWIKMLEFRFRFHWHLFLRVQLTISHHWFMLSLGAEQPPCHYLHQSCPVQWRIYAAPGEDESITIHHNVSHDDDVMAWKRFPHYWPFMRKTTTNHEPGAQFLGCTIKYIQLVDIVIFKWVLQCYNQRFNQIVVQIIRLWCKYCLHLLYVNNVYCHSWQLELQLSPPLKQKCRYFDNIFITSCTEGYQNDNFQCSQRQAFHQDDDSFVSVAQHK